MSFSLIEIEIGADRLQLLGKRVNAKKGNVLISSREEGELQWGGWDRSNTERSIMKKKKAK